MSVTDARHAHTREIGTPLTSGQTIISLPAAFSAGDVEKHYELLDDTEYQPDLKFPASVKVYDRMRHDSQCHGLMLGSTLPIRNYRWMIDPNGARDELVAELARQLNLPVKGEEDTPKGRRKRRFSHDYHLQHALLALFYGFMMFEQVYDVVDLRARLRKLSPRMPHNVRTILVDKKDGGLSGIKQRSQDETIPVDALVAYVWEREGANWYGRSMLRALYKNWFIKDKLLRVDVLKHQRNGMGVPTLEATHPDVMPHQVRQGLKVMQAWRAGDFSAAAFPYGVTGRLKGVEGVLPDTLASIKYHDEAMARAHLQMFLMLGQTETGSRALGQTFVDYYAIAQKAIARWYADTFNEHVIEDWVDLNYSEEEPAPLLVFEAPLDREFVLTDFLEAIRVGAITVDIAVENFLRRQVGMPLRDPDEPAAPVSDPDATPSARTSGGTRRYRRVLAAQEDAEALSLPARELRRQPYDFEVKSGIDLKALDETWEDAVAKLVDDWEAIRSDQIEELVDQIAAARSVEELNDIVATAKGSDVLRATLMDVAANGVGSALAEAGNQRQDIDAPKPADYAEPITERSTATAASIATALEQSAKERAIGLSGGGLTFEEVSRTVREHLESLSNAYLEERFGGAVSQAQNTGRMAVFNKRTPNNVYSSEILDRNTCSNCTAIDGTDYPSLDEARRDYPSGGYVGCEGRERCRGLLIASYEEEDDDEEDDA